MISTEAAIEKLIKGNERFISGEQATKELSIEKREDLIENGQHPFAAILCCSDSRVPPEILFDLGLGDIFVIRTAGNVVDDIGLGSIEYAALHLHVPLIVVLGHEKCGAVKATVDGGEIEGSIKVIVNKIKPSHVLLDNATDMYSACENKNIFNTVNEIKNDSILNALLIEGKLNVIGAKYSISSGVVTFFNS